MAAFQFFLRYAVILERGEKWTKGQEDQEDQEDMEGKVNKVKKLDQEDKMDKEEKERTSFIRPGRGKKKASMGFHLLSTSWSSPPWSLLVLETLVMVIIHLV